MKLLVIKGLLLITALCLPLWGYIYFFPASVLHQESSHWAFTADVIHGMSDLPEPELLVMGDSRIMAGVLPKEMDGETLSIALGGSTPLEAYHSLRTYLENQSAPAGIVLGISPVHFETQGSYRYRTLKFNFLDFATFSEVVQVKRAAGQPYLEDVLLYGLHRLRFPLLYVPELQKAVFKPRHRLNRMTYSDRRDHLGYVARGKAEKVSAAAENEEAGRKRFTPDPVNRYFFEKFIRLCADNDIRLLFVTLPLNAATNRLITEQYRSGYSRYVDSLMQNHPGFLYETEIMVFPDVFFGDPSHLNYNGAIRFTAYLSRLYPTMGQEVAAGLINTL